MHQAFPGMLGVRRGKRGAEKSQNGRVFFGITGTYRPRGVSEIPGVGPRDFLLEKFTGKEPLD